MRLSERVIDFLPTEFRVPSYPGVLTQEEWKKRLKRAGLKVDDVDVKTKHRLRMGLNTKTTKRNSEFNEVVQKIKNRMRKIRVSSALKIAEKVVKQSQSKVKIPHKLAFVKKGSVLPLIPIFAALSAIGALSGGAAQVVNAVSGFEQARKKLEEKKRHNQAMEAIAVGNGMYLKPYKKGYGLFLHSKNTE